jgi:D-alanyl-D-alanine carboxypeptidase
MNQKAAQIGMTNTFYDDPSGLSDKNVSTLNDLVALTNYVYKNYPEILEITHQKSYSSKGRTWFNNSKFRNDKNYYAGKNGYTNEARQTLVSIFELPIGSENEKRLINFVVLGSDTAEQDVRDLILYTLQNIEYVSN